jgi:hypothetical protein
MKVLRRTQGSPAAIEEVSEEVGTWYSGSKPVSSHEEIVVISDAVRVEVLSWCDGGHCDAVEMKKGRRRHFGAAISGVDAPGS